MRSPADISLPASLRDWVAKQASENGYSSASEFVAEILRRERERSRIDEHLMAAIAGGESTPMTSADWRKIRADGTKLARARRKK